MRTCRAITTLVVASCVALTSASAHPIHTTLTALTISRGEITLTVRTFADDFSASVATFAGKQPTIDWSVDDVDVARYLAANLRVVDDGGKVLLLRSCGIRREREVYWLCVRVEGATALRGLRAENRLLTERHADQVNIVQINAGSVRKTLLFTKDTAGLPLSG